MQDIYKEKTAWLGRYTVLGRECARLRGEIEEWRSMGERMTRVIDTVPGGGGFSGSVVERAAEEINLLESELAEQLSVLVRKRRQMEKAISGVGDERLRHLLRLRYVNGLRWVEVAEQMYYSDMQTMRLHKAALDALRLPGQDDAAA